MAVGVSSVVSLSRAPGEGIHQQEITRTGSRLVDGIVRALETADASTLVFSDVSPERITFQQVLGYDPAEGRVLSRPVTIRPVTLDGGIDAVEEQRAGSGVEGEQITVCLPDHVSVGPVGPLVTDVIEVPDEGDPEEGDRTTAAVLFEQLSLYLAVGATIGACGTETVPAEAVLGSPPRILGAGLAAADLDDPSLPALHFAVRVEEGRTFVDVAVTVRSGPQAERRFARTVLLFNQ